MKILGREVKLWRSKRKASVYGEFKMDPSPHIWLNRRYSLARQNQTAIHEYFHAVYAMTREPEKPMDEEAAAILFELAVLDLWFNNRHLLEQLVQEESHGQATDKVRAADK